MRYPELCVVDLRRKFTQLVPYHILGDSDIVVDLAVVDLENEADKVRQNCCAACLGLDWRCSLAWFWSHDRKAEDGQKDSIEAVVAGMLLGLCGVGA